MTLSAPLRRVMVRGLTALVPLIAVAPASAGTLFALIDTGELHASIDAGATWSVHAAIPLSDGAGLVAGAEPNELFLAGRSGTIHRSINNGADWSMVAAVGASDVVDLVARPERLVILTAAGIAWGVDPASFVITPLGSIPASDLVALARASGGGWCALTASGSIWRSLDDGATWAIAGAIPVPDAVAIRARGAELVVITATGLTWRSADQGITWVATGTASQTGVSWVALSSAPSTEWPARWT